MAETTTAENNAAKPVEPRRLYPGLAFFAGLLGFGYLYVGRIAYAIVFVIAPYLYFFVVGWTRWIVEPIGWYVSFPIVGLWWLVQIAHPTVLAWSRPVAPAKPYNRWWCYAAWFAASVVIVPDGGMFGAASYYTPSGSMIPTLQPGDRIVVDTWRYRDTSPAFGDIVVCEFGDGTLVIKRVVGVPGDTLELRGPQLVRNGNLVDEPYLNLADARSLPNSPPLTLGDDEFFVLGDYRGNSNDSRQRGPLRREQIFGRVEFIAYARSRDRFPLVLASD